METLELKNNIRANVLSRRNALSVEEMYAKSNVITKKVLALKEYATCRTLFAYVSFMSEVQTDRILQDAFDKGKRVALPVVRAKTKDMVFIQVENLDSLVRSKFGVLEPAELREKIVESDKETLILVPGAAFDSACNRIGYGGGYYDKYLSNHMCMKKMGLAYDCQLVDKVPVCEHDVPLDGIIAN